MSLVVKPEAEILRLLRNLMISEMGMRMTHRSMIMDLVHDGDIALLAAAVEELKFTEHRLTTMRSMWQTITGEEFVA